MNLTDYTYLLNHPEAVNDKQTQALDKIVHEFPYFQSARALRLKGLYNQNSFQYNYALKVAAAYTTDRSVLFDFITSDTFTVIEKGVYQEKQEEIYTIDVKGSEIVGTDNTVSPEGKIEQSILTSIEESAKPYVEEEYSIDHERIESLNEGAFHETVQDEEVPAEENLAETSSKLEVFENEVEISTPVEEEIAKEVPTSDMIPYISETIDNGSPSETDEAEIIVIDDVVVIPEDNEVEEEIAAAELSTIEKEAENSEDQFDAYADDEITVEDESAQPTASVPADQIEIELESADAETKAEEFSFIPEIAEFTDEEIAQVNPETISSKDDEQSFANEIAHDIAVTPDLEIEEVEIVENKNREEPVAEQTEESSFTTPVDPVLPITVYIPEPLETADYETVKLPITPISVQPEEVGPFEISPVSVEDSKIEIPIVEIPNQTIEFIPKAETALPDMGKPLEFSSDEKHSFREWLQLSSMKPIIREEDKNDVTEHVERKKKIDLIDRFIRTSPKISPVKDFKPSEPSEMYREDNSALMTETLARVYLEQKKYGKAIQAYEILILKYPEKSIFFADRISEIKKLQQNL